MTVNADSLSMQCRPAVCVLPVVAVYLCLCTCSSRVPVVVDERYLSTRLVGAVATQ